MGRELRTTFHYRFVLRESARRNTERLIRHIFELRRTERRTLTHVLVRMDGPLLITLLSVI